MGLPSGQLSTPLSSPSATVNPGAEFGNARPSQSQAQATPFMPSVVTPAPLTEGEIAALTKKLMGGTGMGSQHYDGSPFDYSGGFDPFGGGHGQ